MNITSTEGCTCNECGNHMAEYRIQLENNECIFLCHDCAIELEVKLNNTMNHK